MRATRNAELVLRDPPPKIFLVDFADHAVIYEIKFYMGNHAAINEVNDAIRTNVWYKLKRQANHDSLSDSDAARGTPAQGSRAAKIRSRRVRSYAASLFFSVWRRNNSMLYYKIRDSIIFGGANALSKKAPRAIRCSCSCVASANVSGREKRFRYWCRHTAFRRLFRRNVTPYRRTPHRHRPRSGRLLRYGNQQASHGRSHSAVARMLSIN